MYKYTKNFVRSCTVCLSRKNAFKIPPAPHQPVEQNQEPGETCHIYIFGPLKTTPTGNSYVLSMIDAFTKYIHIVPLPDIKSSTISKAFFDNYIVHRGYPHKLVVDNATYFKGSEFFEFCRVMGNHKRHISSYSAHVNGRVEKPNQSLANILAPITQNTSDWDEQLPHTMLALNSAIHEATYTSFFPLEHGRDIRLSYTYEKNSDTPQNKHEYVEKLLPYLEQIFNKALKNLNDQEASHVDLSTRATKQHHYDYKIGPLCFIKTPNIKSNLSPKLRPKFEGPYRTFDVLPSSTGNFLLIVDGLQTFDVLPSSTGVSSTHRGRTADLLMCCPAGVTNFLRSIDASAIFLVGTHMIAALSSRDGTFFFSFLLVVIFLCAVYLREGRIDGRPELPNL
ncbi:integrase catalytic domain-containing protein [Trichonephila clavipes]|nr:integrase catalytic domain-containing protein [Trichonephila clavipes]